MTKISITASLDSEAKKILERRAKKELMTLQELVEDILRRSAINYSGNSKDKVDDKFLTYFSRKQKRKKS